MKLMVLPRKEVLPRSSPLLPAVKLVLTGADVEQGTGNEHTRIDAVVDEDVEMEPVFLSSGNRKWKRRVPIRMLLQGSGSSRVKTFDISRSTLECHRLPLM